MSNWTLEFHSDPMHGPGGNPFRPLSLEGNSLVSMETFSSHKCVRISRTLTFPAMAFEEGLKGSAAAFYIWRIAK